MCKTYSQALSYVSDESINWTSEEDKSICENAIKILDKIESTYLEKEAALADLNDLYWNSSEISDKNCFGQCLFGISYTVDPGKPVPVKM